MTLDQILASSVISGAIVLLIWGRLRYDLVALCALLAGIACGVVPLDRAFTGFSDDIVIIVGSALVLSAAVSRSGIVDVVMRPLSGLLRKPRLQVPILVTIVTVMSALVKNIGAVAMLLPISLQIAKQTQTPPGRLLMPIAFGSLLGGLATQIGTSPNIIVSRMRGEITGEPFSMFDFTPVGAGLAIVGVLFLSFAWRLLPEGRKSASTGQKMFEIGNYTTEAVLPAKSPLVNKTVRDLETLADGEVSVIAIIREQDHRYVPAQHWVLYENDILILEGDADELKKLMDAGGLVLSPTKHISGSTAAKPAEDLGVLEAVVGDGSVLIGSTAEELRLRDRYGVVIFAIRRRGRRMRQRLRQIRFQAGDLVVLHGRVTDMPDIVASLGCLPLAERGVRLGRPRPVFPPVAILIGTMVLVAFGIVPVVVAFFGAAVLVLLLKALTLKEAYQYVDWPILILLGALIPVSGALQTTGVTDLIAGWLSQVAGTLPPLGALAMILVAAMLVTPFLNNAATVLVMAPIGAGLADRLGLSVDPFLMAVAVGAGCDFLTPIGHQCNTLVMGPGGYKFEDYPRLGAPLSLLILMLAPLLISFFWPLNPSR